MTSTHVRESKTLLDSRSKQGTGFCLSVKLRFRIPVISGILDSLSFILDSKAQDSIFHYKHKFPGFRNPHSLTWGE